MKTKEEIPALNKRPDELAEQELAQVTGGIKNWESSDGKTSTIISDDDITWLYEESFDHDSPHK